VTGALWSGGPDGLVKAVAGFDTAAVDPAACVRNAARFDTSVFAQTLPARVEAAVAVASAQREERGGTSVVTPGRRPVRRGLARL